MAIFVIIALVTWLVMSIANQVNSDQLARYNWLQCLPNWRFFAPKPAVTDYHLLFRQRLENGEITNWQEVGLVGERGGVPLLWNPRRREYKALFDLISSMQLSTANKNRERLMLSVPYLALIHHVSMLPTFSVAREHQSLVISVDHTRPESKSEVLILTEFHKIG